MIERKESILTNKLIEEVETLKDFPVSMCTVPSDYNKFKYLDMIFCICKETGIIQIKKFPSLNDMYLFQHNFSFGSTWTNLFLKFTELINDFLQHEKELNVVEIGASECQLANNILTNKNNNSYQIFEKNSSFKDLNEKITVVNEYFGPNSYFSSNINLVIHSHLIEHVWNPVEFIQVLKQKLNFGTYHCFIVPNLFETFSKKFTNSINFEHNFFIIEDYLDIILNNNSFTICKKEYYLDHSIMYFTRLDKKEIIYKQYPNLYLQNKKLIHDFFNYQKDIVKTINSKTINFDGELYLFGAHIFSQYLIFFGLDTSKIRRILDNCKNKNKRRLYGTKFLVEYPNVINSKEKVGVILKAASYQETIRNQLLDINKNVIIFE